MVERAENSLCALRVAVESTSSSQKPIQVAQQIVQSLSGTLSPAELLDSLTRPMAFLLRDQCNARFATELSVMAHDDPMSQETERRHHVG